MDVAPQVKAGALSGPDDAEVLGGNWGCIERQRVILGQFVAQVQATFDLPMNASVTERGVEIKLEMELERESHDNIKEFDMKATSAVLIKVPKIVMHCICMI